MKVLLSLFLGGVLSGAADGMLDEKLDTRHVARAAIAGGLLLMAGYLKKNPEQVRDELVPAERPAK